MGESSQAPSCPACRTGGMKLFHAQDGVPTNSCLLLATSDEAVNFPNGDLQLGYCHTCGFISNVVFDPNLAEYSSRYEETQAFSPRFVEFAEALAKTWVDKHDLAGKHVIEIGCGKGEFLVMMAEAGIGSGIGIDPGVDTSRIDPGLGDRLGWVPGLFDESYGALDADAIVCRHTLEHISPVGDFVRLLRNSIGDRLDTVVLFELPDTQRVLDEVAFWDVYYEHCSYFSAGSLSRLFERCGFEVLDVSLAYDDQYLLLEARPVPEHQTPTTWPADDMEALGAGLAHFESSYGTTIDTWRARLDEVAQRGATSVIWGAGSKGVAFLIAAGRHISAAVDINPNKHGMYMAGTGHRIVAPEDLKDIDPELVVVMNPIYLDEIGDDLAKLGVAADVVAL